MPQFANALKADAHDPSELRLAWLAGLLEAEGTFLCPPPSMPNCPIVSCRMTDRDVVERVGSLFGTKVIAIDKGRYRTEYAATLKGSGAVALMTDIKLMMSDRRRDAISKAVNHFQPPDRKLDFGDAEEIRRRHALGDSIASLADTYNVARQTIYPIVQNRLYRNLRSRPWRVQNRRLTTAEPPLGMSAREFHWLAGWLEGEGSFMAPPPSDPRRPRVSGISRDQDVGVEVGRLFRVRPVYENSERIRAHGWSPTWRVLIRGGPARALMLSLRPVVGDRRRMQIDTALAKALQAENRGTFATSLID